MYSVISQCQAFAARIRRSIWLPALISSLLFSGFAYAQTAGFPFQIRIQQGSNVVTVANGSGLVVGADNVGQTTVLKVNLSYRGQTTATFPQLAEFLGSTDFQLVFPNASELPIVLMPTQSLSFDIQFRPTTTNRVSAQFELPFAEAPPLSAPPGTQPLRGFVSLSLTGTAPDIVVSYVLQSELNVLGLAPGAKLVFPPTLVNGASQALVIISNRGSGAGTVNVVSVTGAAFQAQGLPLFPVTLSSGQDFRFTLRYTPKQIETSTGKMQVTVGERVLSFDLEGSAISSTFAYEVLLDENPLTIQPGETFTLPDTVLGERTNVAIRIRNVGNSDGPINSINLIGTGFLLTDVPFLPQTLAPNAALVFTLIFAPQQAGESKGRLRIGNDSFEVTAKGIGPRLTYAYVAGTVNTPVAVGGPVIFSPVSISDSAQVNFVVHNAGTAPTTIANIGIVEPRSPFSIVGLPSLPVQLEADGSLQFGVVFKPTSPGFTSATLRIDAASFVLSGSGTPLPNLPGYRIRGVSDVLQPLQQPSVGLDLDAPYPVALTGILELSVQPDSFNADPAVQFSTGGRAVAFTIPANTTAAVFSNGSREVRLQTGTVSGAIILTPSFATTGGFSVTPDPPATMRATVLPGPPQLLNLQVASRTPTGLTLAITGYATTRSLSRLDFRFTSAPNFNVPNTTVTVNIASDADGWFRSTASQAFGGQFFIQVPFTLRSDQASVTSPLDALQSVAVTATNERGASNSLTVDLKQ